MISHFKKNRKVPKNTILNKFNKVYYYETAPAPSFIFAITYKNLSDLTVITDFTRSLFGDFAAASFRKTLRKPQLDNSVVFVTHQL